MSSFYHRRVSCPYCQNDIYAMTSLKKAPEVYGYEAVELAGKARRKLQVDRRKVYELYTEGLSVEKIASTMGCSAPTITTILRDKKRSEEEAKKILEASVGFEKLEYGTR